MRSENAGYESPNRDARSAVWNIVAARAGYLDPEYSTAIETFSGAEAVVHRSSWRIGLYLKRLATMTQQWLWR